MAKIKTQTRTSAYDRKKSKTPRYNIPFGSQSRYPLTPIKPLDQWEGWDGASKQESFAPFKTPTDKLMAETPTPKMIKQTGLSGVEMDEPNATISFHGGTSRKFDVTQSSMSFEPPKPKVVKGTPSAPKSTPKVTSTQSKKATKSSFSSEFAKARKSGLESFEYGGKKFNTMEAGETKEQWKQSLQKRTTINREKITTPLLKESRPPSVIAAKDKRPVPKTASEMGFGMSAMQVYNQKAKKRKK